MKGTPWEDKQIALMHQDEIWKYLAEHANLRGNIVTAGT